MMSSPKDEESKTNRRAPGDAGETVYARTVRPRRPKHANGDQSCSNARRRQARLTCSEAGRTPADCTEVALVIEDAVHHGDRDASQHSDE